MGEGMPRLRPMLDVLASDLRGIVGRTKLLRHLRDVPEHGGKPTHRRVGPRIKFSPEDIKTLIESLECPSRSSLEKDGKTSTYAEPSEGKAYTKALERLTRSRQRLTGQNARRNSGPKVSMASVRS